MYPLIVLYICIQQWHQSCHNNVYKGALCNYVTVKPHWFEPLGDKEMTLNYK